MKKKDKVIVKKLLAIVLLLIIGSVIGFENLDDFLDDGVNQDTVSENQNEANIEDEDAIINEEALLENDALVEQENISYDGDNTGKGSKLLGKCTGKLVYYSQIDSRWKNVPYTNPRTNNPSQTIGTSGCGPTSASMIVSSSKGAILPTTMSNLFVANGFRTNNNGTAWSCWSFVADFFDFDFYKSTSSFSVMKNYIKQDKNKDGISDNFAVISCGYGLWTSSGHYICIMDYIPETDEFVVYDPYIYPNKYNTTTRKPAKVRVEGNTAYVKSSAFKTYSNAKNYWVYSNDYKSTSEDTKTSNTNPDSASYTRYVSTKSSPLNVRKTADGNSTILTSLKKGTKVTVKKTKGSWSYIISPVTGWVSTKYLSKTKPTPIVTYKTKVGRSYRLKNNTNLYSKSNLSGTSYYYYAKTELKVLKNVSTSVVYVQAVKTSRKAYVGVGSLVL